MMRTGLLTAGLMTAAAQGLALPDADQRLLDEVLLDRVRPLAIETTLVADATARARIVAPSREPWLGAALRVQAAVQAVTGVELPLVDSAQFGSDEWAKGNIIAVGNLLACPVYARLYHNFFACADAGYTGTAGFELRSVHEPFGPGGNVIALGAQGQEGLGRGVERLAEHVRKHGQPGQLALPRLLELQLDADGARGQPGKRLATKDVEAGKRFYENVYARPGTERGAAHRAVRDAVMYHRTGEEGYLELYRYGILRHIRYYAENEYINQEGLGRYDRDFRDSWTWKFVVAWDLLEEHPSWTDEERLLITNHVLRCVLECNMYQHWMGKDRVEEWRNFDSITHNHHTWPGLADLFGGWYFQRHYQHPMAADWLTIARGMFNGCKQSSKPWEDSAAYQWIPMGHILTYSNAADDSTYIDAGHAAETGKVALMCLDSLGHQPAFGDHSSFTSASRLPEMLSALEYATRDGRYRWALEWLGAASGGELEEPYYTDVGPVRPDDMVGVSVSYLPARHFALNGLNPQYFPKANIPLEQSFDKLTLRAGWESTDDYLLLDGYSGGSHGHQDCNAIIGFTAGGAHWLVDGEYILQTPKHHCSVTVVRDGAAIRNPAMARLADAVWFGDAAICRTTIPDYNGMCWSRYLFWVPNTFTAVIDELTPNEPGEYSLRCCWRVYGDAAMDGDTLRLHQDDKQFALANLSGDAQELVHVKDVGKWPVHHLYQRRSAKLQPGQRVCFVNVFRASPEPRERLYADLSAQSRGFFTLDGKRFAFGTGTLDVDGARAEASAWLVDASATRLASATKLSMSEESAFESREPVALRVKRERAHRATSQPTPVSGQRPVEVLDEVRVPGLDTGFEVSLDVLCKQMPRTEPEPAAALSGARALPVRWCFDSFPRTPVALRVHRVTTDPEPHARYSPAERLLDGQYTSSLGSCMFPPGATTTIDLDLGKAQAVTEVRIRAWEMNESWHTRGRRLFQCTEPAAQDWQAVPGAFEVVGTERWGNNVNTIYALAVADTVRHLRLVVEPKSDDCTVYLAEIEVIGTQAGEPPELTAIAAGDVDGDGQPEAAVAAGAGHIIVLDADGQERWGTKTDARITALATAALDGKGRHSVVYGAARDTLGVVDPEGRLVKNVNIPAYRGIPSEPQNITVADLDGDGQPSIVVGVRSWQYLAYTPQLELEWKHVIYAHSATVAEVADLDGDGRLETVAGNAYFCLNIIDSTGQRRLRAGRFGPEQSAVTSGDLDGDGRREVVIGTDGGDVLVFDLEGKQRWERNVGDRVTSLCVTGIDGTPAVVAASESGFVWALDANGEPRWRVNLAEPVRRLCRLPDGFACAASAAGVVTLSLQGVVTGVGATRAPAMDMVRLDGVAVAALNDGSVCGVALE